MARNPMSLYPVDNPYAQQRSMMQGAASSFAQMDKSGKSETTPAGKTGGGAIQAGMGGAVAGGMVSGGNPYVAAGGAVLGLAAYYLG